MRTLFPCIMTIALLLLCDASNVVRTPLEANRPSYGTQRGGLDSPRGSGRDDLIDKQWQDQQRSVDSMRRKSEQEILQRQKSGQQQVVPEKK